MTLFFSVTYYCNEMEWWILTESAGHAGTLELYTFTPHVSGWCHSFDIV